jgi:hypothetical protein
MDGFQICKEITGLHDSIIEAEIAEKGTAIAAHTRSGSSSSMQKLERLIVQTELYINILEQSSQEQLGKPHYLMAHNDNIDLFFFPIIINGRKMILVVMIAVPYEHEQLISKIREYIGNMRLANREIRKA